MFVDTANSSAARISPTLAPIAPSMLALCLSGGDRIRFQTAPIRRLWVESEYLRPCGIEPDRTDRKHRPASDPRIHPNRSNMPDPVPIGEAGPARIAGELRPAGPVGTFIGR